MTLCIRRSRRCAGSYVYIQNIVKHMFVSAVVLCMILSIEHKSRHTNNLNGDNTNLFVVYPTSDNGSRYQSYSQPCKGIVVFVVSRQGRRKGFAVAATVAVVVEALGIISIVTDVSL